MGDADTNDADTAEAAALNLLKEARRAKRGVVRRLIDIHFKETHRFTLPTLELFDAFRELCDVGRSDDADWGKPMQLKSNGGELISMHINAFGIDVYKLTVVQEGISSETFYNMLHDPVFRKTWDKNMIAGFNICRPSKYCDIGFYSFDIPIISRRRSVAQRNWHKFNDNEFVIFNHSVDLPKQYEQACKANNCEYNKSYVDVESYCSGYYMKDIVDTDGKTKCKFVYVSCSDAKITLPNMILNRILSQQLPKGVDNLFTQALKYEEWVKDKTHPKTWLTDNWAKSSNSPEYKSECEESLKALEQDYNSL